MANIVDSLTNSIQAVTIDKKNKKNLTSYWGVSLNISSILNIPEIKSFLETHPELIFLEKIHSTLLFVGKKENENEKYFVPLEGKQCKITIAGYGYSEKALALDVVSITYVSIDGEITKVPSYSVKQHVTTALSMGTKAVDSVKTLLGEGTYVKLPQNIVTYGEVKRFLY